MWQLRMPTETRNNAAIPAFNMARSLDVFLKINIHNDGDTRLNQAKGFTRFQN